MTAHGKSRRPINTLRGLLREFGILIPLGAHHAVPTTWAQLQDAESFPSARHFASYLGLTPRESSSGLRRRLGAISKRADVYLRTLLIHGARSVLLAAKRRHPDRLRAWALAKQSARGHNKASVALANKLARIIWAVWKHDRPFHSVPQVA